MYLTMKSGLVDIDSFHHFVIGIFISVSLYIPYLGQSLLSKISRNSFPSILGEELKEHLENTSLLGKALFNLFIHCLNLVLLKVMSSFSMIAFYRSPVTTSSLVSGYVVLSRGRNWCISSK